LGSLYIPKIWKNKSHVPNHHPDVRVHTDVFHGSQFLDAEPCHVDRLHGSRNQEVKIRHGQKTNFKDFLEYLDIPNAMRLTELKNEPYTN
jgi:hypothetical protein